MKYTSQHWDRGDQLLALASAVSPVCLVMLALRRLQRRPMEPALSSRARIWYPPQLPTQPPSPQRCAAAASSAPEVSPVVAAPPPAWNEDPSRVAAPLAASAMAAAVAAVAGGDAAPTPPLAAAPAAADVAACAPLAPAAALAIPPVGGAEIDGGPVITQQEPTNSLATLAQRLLAHQVRVSIVDRDEPVTGRIAASNGDLLVLLTDEEAVTYVSISSITALGTVAPEPTRKRVTDVDLDPDDDDAIYDPHEDRESAPEDEDDCLDEAGDDDPRPPATRHASLAHSRGTPAAHAPLHWAQATHHATKATTNARQMDVDDDDSHSEHPVAAAVDPEPDQAYTTAPQCADDDEDAEPWPDHHAHEPDADEDKPAVATASAVPSRKLTTVKGAVCSPPITCIVGPGGYKLISVFRPPPASRS